LEAETVSSHALSFAAAPGEIAAETSSTLKAFGVLEVLVRAGRAVTLSELMQATELPKPTLHRALALFEDAGFLAREPGGRAYVIGERLSRFGLEVLRNDGAATERRIVLRRVVNETGESCNLAVLQKGALTYLDRIEADWPLRLQIPVGGVAIPPHCCASGKLLLAYRPAAERQRLLQLMALPRFTERTIIDRQVLASEFDRIVGAGYAVDNEEYVLGVACVAVPVRSRHGEVIASVAVQGATARLPLMRAIEFVPRLQAAAVDIGSTFG
jgi:IclR family transcriptional regulator, acetate operon repressor